jgi:CHAD domain-containing protein
MTRFHLPPEFDETSLVAGLEGSHELVFAPDSTLTAIPLDTFDWRLYKAGLVLVEERGRDRRLVLSESGREPYSIVVRSTPITAADLPAGHLADKARPLMEIRALVPIGAAHVKRSEGRIQNTEGEMVARLRFETVEPLDRDGNPTSATDTLEIRGGTAAADLSHTCGLCAIAEYDLEAVAAASGRTPGDYSSKFRVDLDPDQPAGLAVRTILLSLLTTIEANVEGTIDDIDTEFLHDLRVACRRTRSALTQLKGALPTHVTTPFNTEFKWLGGLTGPLRDLDVFLLEMPTYRALLPPHASAALKPLEDLIKSTRARALSTVARALCSARFKGLVTSWRQTLETIDASPGPSASLPTLELANKRIRKAHRRILKLGGGLHLDPPAESLHRLRIDAKKLRYLFEFFRRLYAAEEVNARIKELKRIQDILGGFNDMEVQHERLADFARRLHADPKVDASCILAMGRLAGTLEDRQEAYRLAFHDAFNGFDSASARAAFGELVGGKGSK